MDRPYTHEQIKHLKECHEKEIFEKLPYLPSSSMGWDIMHGELCIDISAGSYGMQEMEEVSEVLSRFFKGSHDSKVYVDVDYEKAKILNEAWGGWRYLWIRGEDGDTNLHEAYQDSEFGISWTENPTHVAALPKALEEITFMAKYGIIFDEKELFEYNENLED